MKQFKVLNLSEQSLHWIINASYKFPKQYRFNFTQRLCDIALEFNESLILAQENRSQSRLETLQHANAKLVILINYLRIAYEWQCISASQYKHIAKRTEELTRLLVGWQNATRRGK